MSTPMGQATWESFTWETSQGKGKCNGWMEIGMRAALKIILLMGMVNTTQNRTIATTRELTWMGRGMGKARYPLRAMSWQDIGKWECSNSKKWSTMTPFDFLFCYILSYWYIDGLENWQHVSWAILLNHQPRRGQYCFFCQSLRRSLSAISHLVYRDSAENIKIVW